MREIKFRAWDKNGDGMFYEIQTGIEFDDGSEYPFFNFLKKNGIDVHEWELMQFTGLHDKNGKEIYEGDIVEFPTKWQEEKGIKHRGVIEWRDEDMMYWIVDIDGKGSFTGTSNLWDGNSVVGDVIGNIHENPELLKLNQ